MYVITVKLEDYKTLKFKVLTYLLKENHVTFTDTHTGRLKSFPSQICLIEEVTQ